MTEFTSEEQWLETFCRWMGYDIKELSEEEKDRLMRDIRESKKQSGLYLNPEKN